MQKCPAKFYNKRTFELHENYDVHLYGSNKYTCPIKTCGKKLGRKIKVSPANIYIFLVKYFTLYNCH